jgi:hypothetical protein
MQAGMMSPLAGKRGDDYASSEAIGIVPEYRSTAPIAGRPPRPHLAVSTWISMRCGWNRAGLGWERYVLRAFEPPTTRYDAPVFHGR